MLQPCSPWSQQRHLEKLVTVNFLDAMEDKEADDDDFEVPMGAGVGKNVPLLNRKMEYVLSRYDLHCVQKKNQYSLNCWFWRDRFIQFERFVAPLCEEPSKPGCVQFDELRSRFKKIESTLHGKHDCAYMAG